VKTPGDLRRRIERLEQRSPAGSLSPAEQGELASLEAARAARPPIDDWSDREVERYLLTGGDPDGTARRLDELRRRNRTPAEIAREAEMARMIGALDLGELNAFMAGRDAATREENAP
jgi:hypothetical protein